MFVITPDLLPGAQQLHLSSIALRALSRHDELYICQSIAANHQQSSLLHFFLFVLSAAR